MGAAALFASLVLVVAACGDQTQTTGSDGDDLADRTFLSTKVTEAGEPRDLVDKSRIRLLFTPDGRLIAGAGCNQLQGPVDLGDGKISLPEGLSMTERGCEPPAHYKQDSWLSRVLQAEPTWRLDQNTLVVTSGETELMLQDREVAEPDMALEGTTWLVFTYVDKETASHKDYVPGAKQQPYLEFADGEVTGWTGCNRFSGPATIEGDHITFGAIVSTKVACDGEVAADEAHVLDVLQGKVSYEVDANSLELRHPNGKGLGLDAKSS